MTPRIPYKECLSRPGLTQKNLDRVKTARRSKECPSPQ